MTEQTIFDAASAQHFNRRPGGSRHHAYTDANGSVCLWCRGRSPRGGAAVSLSALAWLRERDGAKFVRLTNPARGLDEIVPLAELPEKDTRDGPGGSYIFIDPEDLHGPDFAPVGDDVPF
ncbi:MAG: hypothetical protein AAF092_16740 [Pseudomonadota bacterium]